MKAYVVEGDIMIGDFNAEDLWNDQRQTSVDLNRRALKGTIMKWMYVLFRFVLVLVGAKHGFRGGQALIAKIVQGLLSASAGGGVGSPDRGRKEGRTERKHAEQRASRRRKRRKDGKHSGSPLQGVL